MCVTKCVLCVMDFRRGDRSREKFHRDRRSFEWAEEEIMHVLKEEEESQGNFFSFYRTNDDSGEITKSEDLHKIRTPDFHVDCMWKRGLLEVKTHERWWNVQRGNIKVSSIQSCIENCADLLMVDPLGFFWLTTSDMRELLSTGTRSWWRLGATEHKASITYVPETLRRVWYQYWSSSASRRIHYIFACARNHQNKSDDMSLQSRRDHRDERAFARDIKKGTDVEHAIMRLLCVADPDMTYEDCGVDSSGEVIQDDPNNQLPDFELPDYRRVRSRMLDIDGSYLEVKTHPLWHKKPVGHVKLGSLRGCLDVEAHLLMADMDGFYMFRPEALAAMVKEGVRIARWGGGGGKPAMQYNAELLKRWDVVRHEWPSCIRDRAREELRSLMQVRRE